MLLRAGALAAAGMLCAACPSNGDDGGDGGGDGGPDGPDCTIGDRAQPIEVAPLTAGFDGVVVDLADGAMVDLVRPIQGGKVIYVGFKAKNVDGCHLNLTAALRDPTNNLVFALEQRPVILDVAADGWGMPRSAFFSLANVPACPNAVATSDIDQGTWRLEMRLEEDGGRQAELALDVLPRCRESSQMMECECECDSDYELGGPCPTDP